MNQVAVVILNFKVKALTLKCIDSVKNSDFKDLEIIVVDNDSGDGIGQDLKKDSTIKFIQNNKNSGFSGGNNLGIQQALKDQSEYILILNPDTTVDQKAIGILVKKMKQYDTDIVCPKIYFDDKKTIWYAGGLFDKANVLGSHRGVDEEDKGQYDQDSETDGITGAALMIKREVFEKIGLFDDRYFLYYEDSDLYFRAKQANFKIMYIADAKVYHKNAQSTGLGSPIQDYYITRNRMIFAGKFLSLRTRFALFREGLRNFRSPVKRLALKDFLFGNLGKGGLNV